MRRTKRERELQRSVDRLARQDDNRISTEMIECLVWTVAMAVVGLLSAAWFAWKWWGGFLS